MKKILALLLALLILSACSEDAPEPPPETTQRIETTASAPATITLNAPDACYTIIRPDRASETLTQAAADFCMVLREKAGKSKLRIETDWVKNEADAQNDKWEILIGDTNRAESASARDALPTYLDFVIAVDGNKIAINANTEGRLLEAIEYFAAQITVEDGMLTYSQGTTYIGAYDRYTLPSLTIGGKTIGEFVIVLPEAASERETKLAAELQDYLKQNNGAILPIRTDAEAMSACEILIGRTNRTESAAAVAVESTRCMTVGTKLVLLSDKPLYYSALKSQLIEHLQAEKGSIASDLDLTSTYTGLDYFVKENYAADLIAKIDEDLNPGVQALLSCCEYYNDMMRADSAKGNRWIYSSNAKYVTQVCRFDDMLYNFTAKGGNCAAPTNWAFIDMEIMPDTYRFWGDSDGSFARREKVEPYVGQACEIFDVSAEGKTFMELYNAGRIKTGDIFLGKGHTWIYRGAQSFYAAGHDSDWHADPTVVSEDTRHAVFDNWVLSFDECASNCRYGVKFIIRIKDDFMPKYFRNQAGELVENPLAASK